MPALFQSFDQFRNRRGLASAYKKPIRAASGLYSTRSQTGKKSVSRIFSANGLEEASCNLCKISILQPENECLDCS